MDPRNEDFSPRNGVLGREEDGLGATKVALGPSPQRREPLGASVAPRSGAMKAALDSKAEALHLPDQISGLTNDSLDASDESLNLKSVSWRS